MTEGRPVLRQHGAAVLPGKRGGSGDCLAAAGCSTEGLANGPSYSHLERPDSGWGRNLLAQVWSGWGNHMDPS